MSIFNKNSKKKLALALACASIFNGKILAMDKNKAQNSQTITAARNNTLENPKKSRFELARGISVKKVDSKNKSWSAIKSKILTFVNPFLLA